MALNIALTACHLSPQVRVRRLVTEHRRDCLATGGGSQPQLDLRPWEEICRRLMGSDALEGVGEAEVGAAPPDDRPGTSRGTEPPAARPGGKRRRSRVTPSPPATPPTPPTPASPSVPATAPPLVPPPPHPIPTAMMPAAATTQPTPAATVPASPTTQPTPAATPAATPSTTGAPLPAAPSLTLAGITHGHHHVTARPATLPSVPWTMAQTPPLRPRPSQQPPLGSPMDSQDDMGDQDVQVSPSTYSIPDARPVDQGEGGGHMQGVLRDLVGRLGQLEDTCRMPTAHNLAVLAAMERQATAAEQQAAATALQAAAIARLADTCEALGVAAIRQAAASEAILLALQGPAGRNVVGVVGEVKAAVASVSGQLTAASRARCVAERRMRVHSRAHHAATTGIQTAVADLTTEVRLQGQHTCAALAEATAVVREGHAAATLAAVAIPSSSTSPARSAGTLSAGDTPQQSPVVRGRRRPGRPRHAP